MALKRSRSTKSLRWGSSVQAEADQAADDVSGSASVVLDSAQEISHPLVAGMPSTPQIPCHAVSLARKDCSSEGWSGYQY